jgi:hypothetical protein
MHSQRLTDQPAYRHLKNVRTRVHRRIQKLNGGVERDHVLRELVDLAAELGIRLSSAERFACAGVQFLAPWWPGMREPIPGKEVADFGGVHAARDSLKAVA